MHSQYCWSEPPVVSLRRPSPHSSAGHLMENPMPDATVANQRLILANQKTILANQRTILGNQKRIETNQAKLDRLLRNQRKLDQILVNQKRILSRLR
jgi:hypothetical protein